MNTQHSYKETDVQINCPVLDQDFDLFSSEVIDFLMSKKHSQEDSPYMVSFKPASKRRLPWQTRKKT